MDEQALRKLIDDKGGPGKIAAALRITSPAVSQWRRVPALRVIEFERLTGVSREELRPDLYPPPVRSVVEPARAHQ